MFSAHHERKLQARRDLHEELHLTAYVYPNRNPAAVKVAKVRAHTEWGAVGDVLGTSLVYAELNDTKKSKIIFLVEEGAEGRYEPHNHDVVAIAPGEVWLVDNTEPVYNVTQAANVVRLGPKEAESFITPPSLVVYTPTTLMGFLPTCEIEVA